MVIVFAVVSIWIYISNFPLVYAYRIRYVLYEGTSNEFFSLMEHIGVIELSDSDKYI